MDKVFVMGEEKLRYQTNKGYVVDDPKFGVVRVRKYAKCLEDGFVGDAVEEIAIRYDCGLCVSHHPIHRTASWYNNSCVGKRGTMKYAKSLL